MTLDERLKYCKICLNRKMNMNVGLVCGLTNEKPAFEGTCPDIKIDQPEADRLVQLEKEAKEEESSGSFASEQKGIKKGVLGGVVMMVIAVVWFVLGLMADRIFFYPPILFCIGAYALVKGFIQGNYKGEKNS